MDKKNSSGNSKTTAKFFLLWFVLTALVGMFFWLWIRVSKLDSQTLKDEISALYQDVNSLKRSVDSLHLQVNSLPQIQSGSDGSLNSIVYLFLILIVGVFYLVRRKRNKPTRVEEERIAAPTREREKVSKQANPKPSQKANEEGNKIVEQVGAEKGNTKQTINDGARYFKSKNGKILTEELQGSADATFKVFNIKGNEAKFEYCGGVVNQDFFSDVCSFANNPADVPNKTKISTTTPGTIKQNSSCCWEVTEKAKIKFE